MENIKRDKRKPLKGVRITEFTSAWAGPYATCLLGFLGAEVIKVESIQRVDHSRVSAFTTGKSFSGVEESSVFNTLNLNKKSVTLNLGNPKAIELAKKLAAKSDVVVENMRPGVMERLGLGYEVLSALKEDLIYLSSSACGQTGPDREYVGYAPNFAALAGLPHITGYEDWPPSNFMGSIDLRSATTAAFAMMAALVHHQKTGEGQYIDLASQETVTSMCGEVFLDYAMNNRVQNRQGNRDPHCCPNHCYETDVEDCWVAVSVGNNDEFAALTSVMGRDELARDPRFITHSARKDNEDQLDQILVEWMHQQEASQAIERLQKAGVPASISAPGEALFNNPHIKARGTYVKVEHPVIGDDWVIAPPWRISGEQGGIKRHAPLIGEHNSDVFGGYLGLSENEIARLAREKIIY